jgi:hypothetical protein
MVSMPEWALGSFLLHAVHFGNCTSAEVYVSMPEWALGSFLHATCDGCGYEINMMFQCPSGR